MAIELRPHQIDALERMRNGCILNGDTGSGKSMTGLAYYFVKNGGSCSPYKPMKSPQDLYIITIAKKRDSLDWDREMTRFLLNRDPNVNYYKNKIVVDSWNNIKKYVNVTGSFFIFDEQKVCGGGTWSKLFLKITRNNDWILLSATPGDSYMDYKTVFIANGFFKNATEFHREHVIFNPHVSFPQVDRYLNTYRLERLKKSILIDMNIDRDTVQHHIDIICDYDKAKYKDLMKNRFNYEENRPIESASELCYQLRKIVNSDERRLEALGEIFDKHPRVIIFYNYDYELEAIKALFSGYFYTEESFGLAEWNGHKHQPIPDTKKWVYLVNYLSGAEAWECITTDTIVFFSQNYSYKMMKQASGRIDRLNTPYIDLYYYHLKSRANIDLSIENALRNKKQFNESRYVAKLR